MFHSVRLLSQAPLARGSCALPSVLFSIEYSVKYCVAGISEERFLLPRLVLAWIEFNVYLNRLSAVDANWRHPRGSDKTR